MIEWISALTGVAVVVLLFFQTRLLDRQTRLLERQAEIDEQTQEIERRWKELEEQQKQADEARKGWYPTLLGSLSEFDTPLLSSIEDPSADDEEEEEDAEGIDS